MVPLGLYQHWQEEREPDEDTESGYLVTGSSWEDLLLYEDNGARRYFYQSGGNWFDDDAGGSTEIGRFEICHDPQDINKIKVRLIPEVPWVYRRSIDEVKQDIVAPQPPHELHFYQHYDEPQLSATEPLRSNLDSEFDYEPQLQEDEPLRFGGAPGTESFNNIWKRAQEYVREAPRK